MSRKGLDAWIKVRVPKEVKTALKNLAGASQVTVAQVVRNAYEQEVEYQQEVEAGAVIRPQVRPAMERRKASGAEIARAACRPRREPAQLTRARRQTRKPNPAPQGHEFKASEYKLVCLRDRPVPGDYCTCSKPIVARDYWFGNIAPAPHFNGLVETLAVMVLDGRNRITGHCIAAVGTLTSVQMHVREVFRLAIVAGAASIIVAHNHPSGDPSPSAEDIAITQRLARAGRLIGIPVLDHVIVGRPAELRRNDFVSLKALGHLST